MRRIQNFACAATLALSALGAAACSSKDSRVDDALNNDLSLAAQQRPATPVDSVSALEAGYTTRAASPVAGAPRAVAPARTVRRSTTSSGSSGSTSGSSPGTSSSSTSSQPATREVTVKNTKRDAAIGAAAGAIIGATTSKDKVKGGLIGAAAGGILGGVIGNNVDKKKKTVPNQ